MAIETGQRPARSAIPAFIAKSGRHKARRIILTENAEAVIERKLGWINRKADGGRSRAMAGGYPPRPLG